MIRDLRMDVADVDPEIEGELATPDTRPRDGS